MTDRSYRFASTAASVSWARREGKLVPLDQSRTGDILVKLYTSTTGHTGILVEPLSVSPGRAISVEGNTSGGDDRDGGSVQERNRALSFWHYCIRLDLSAEERAAMVALARSQIGETEHPFGSNKTKFGVWYGFNGVAWCAIFVSWVVALFKVPTNQPPPQQEEDMGPASVLTSDGTPLSYVVGDDQVAYEYRGDVEQHPRKLSGKWTSGLSATIDQDDNVTIRGRGTDRALYALVIKKDGTFGQPFKLGGKIWPKT